MLYNSLYDSIILDTDSYKLSMPFQYPKGTTNVFSYIESRGGKFPETMFFNLQGWIKTYLLRPIYQEEIDLAADFYAQHGVPFYKEGWQYILDNYNGYLPVEIRAVKEGTVVPTGNVLVTIENTDPACWWLTTHLETSMLRAVWYGTTVATVSFRIKALLKKYLEKTGDVAGLPFKLHDFGARGVSSKESAGIGGAAHLCNFMGSDTISGILYLMNNYNTPVCGFSIPASEHSTITSWGRDHEEDAYANMLNKFAKEGAIVACVSDSYHIYEATKMWGSGDLKEKVLTSGATLVIRPDSGDPLVVIPRMLDILEKLYGYETNSKGYKVLNTVRIIWGDGIEESSILSILSTCCDYLGWSADNFAFGMGGALLQHVNRDTQKFAMKCSAACINGEWVDVFKDPITDPGKASKKGRLDLFKDLDGKFYTGVEDWSKSQLETVYQDGILIRDQSLDEIQQLSSSFLD